MSKCVAKLLSYSKHILKHTLGLPSSMFSLLLLLVAFVMSFVLHVVCVSVWNLLHLDAGFGMCQSAICSCHFARPIRRAGPYDISNVYVGGRARLREVQRT